MDIKAIINNYIATVTKKYFCFEGRTGRKAFWTFILVNFVVNFVLSLIPGVGKILAGIWGLAVLCPTLGITARRLHDTGKTGWLPNFWEIHPTLEVGYADNGVFL